MLKVTGVGVMIVALFTFWQPSLATGVSGMNVGGFAGGISADTGSREWVEVTPRTGDIFSGRPKNSDVALITIYAPGARAGHVLLRQIDAPDGKRALLLTAPTKFAQMARRATIYLRGATEDLVLLELVNRQWQSRIPQRIWTEGLMDFPKSGQELLAFTVNQFGVYWIVPSSHKDSLSIQPGPETGTARYLLGGTTSRAFSAVAWAVLLLVVGTAISRSVYGKGDYSGN